MLSKCRLKVVVDRVCLSLCGSLIEDGYHRLKELLSWLLSDIVVTVLHCYDIAVLT